MPGERANSNRSGARAKVQIGARMPAEGATRRNFHRRLIHLLTSLTGVGLALPALAYLFLPSRSRNHAGWTEAGSVSSVPENKPTELVFQKKRVDGWKTTYERSTAWVVRTGTELVAFAPQCTHLGCGYHWNEERRQFVCPCHDSRFSIDGDVASGPAPRPLDRYEVRIEGERLWLGQVTSSESV